MLLPAAIRLAGLKTKNRRKKPQGGKKMQQPTTTIKGGGGYDLQPDSQSQKDPD